MSQAIIRKMVSDIIKEVSPDVWEDTYRTGDDHLIDFSRARKLEQIAERAVDACIKYDRSFDNLAW